MTNDELHRALARIQELERQRDYLISRLVAAEGEKARPSRNIAYDCREGEWPKEQP